MADELQKLGWDSTRALAESGGSGAVEREPVINKGAGANGDGDVMEQIIKIGSSFYHWPAEERLAKGNAGFSSSETITSGAQLIGVDDTNFNALSGNTDLQSVLDDIDSLLNGIGVGDHDLLAGLGDDDHTQYHNDTRGDVRYYQKTEHVNTSAGVGDAGKPIVLDASGLIASSMLTGVPADNTSDTNVIFGIDENNDGTGHYFQWRNNGSVELMRLDDDGNLGINETSAGTKLQISETAINASTLTTTTAKQLGIYIGANSASNTLNDIYTGLAMGEGYAGIYAYDDGGSAANGLGFFSGNNGGVSEAMRIDSAGLLGVGMAPNTNVLASFSGSIGTTDGTEGAPTHTFYSDPDTGMYRPGLNTLGFSVAGTETLTISSDGYVQVSDSVSPAYRLYDSGGTANQRTFEIVNEAGIANFRSLVDAGSALQDYILSMDLLNRYVGINESSPNSLLDISGVTPSSSGKVVNVDADLLLAGATTTGAHMGLNTSGSGSITTAGTGVAYSRIGTLDVNQPIITNSGGGDTIATAFTLRVATAPTQGTDNYSLWVDDGLSKFEGNSDGVAQFDMLDNTADNFSIVQGSNDYINISTVNGSETITYGEATINPNHIFHGFMGIGEDVPATDLHISKSGSPVSAETGSVAILQNTGTATNNAFLQIHSGYGSTGKAGIYLQSDGSASASMYMTGQDLYLEPSLGAIYVNAGTEGKLSIIDSGGSTMDGDLTFNDSIIFNGTQDYEIKAQDSTISLAGLSSSVPSIWEFFTNDGDATDDLNINVYGVGTSASHSDYERMALKYENANTTYRLRTEAGGSGVVRNLILETGANSDQVFLKADGTVGINNNNPTYALDVNGTFHTYDDGTIEGDLLATQKVYSPIIQAYNTVGVPYFQAYSDDATITINQILGRMYFGGDGGIDHQGAEIRSTTTEIWSAGNAGTELSFWVTPNTTTNLTEAMQIQNSGDIVMGQGLTINTSNGTGGLIVEGDTITYLIDADNNDETVGIGVQHNSGYMLNVYNTQRIEGPDVSLSLYETDSSITADEPIGIINFGGNGGDVNTDAGAIIAYAESTWASDDTPTYLSFFTTPDGSAVKDERMRIGPSGRIYMYGLRTGTTGAAPSGLGSGELWHNTSDDTIRIG